MNWIDPLTWLIAVGLSVPLLTVAVECFAALGRRRADTFHVTGAKARAAVLIPAHNEESGIARTLLSLMPQVRPGDRVLVVADNCTDGTAAIARECGAEVVERFDSVRRGKGYALAFGMDRLRADPPDVVVILDADCLIGDGALGKLVAAAAATSRPAQGAYRMEPPPAAGPERRVAAFAFLVKNVVRPLGLHRLGQPCLLTGSGMAFSWAAITDRDFGHGHIVEDMQFAVDLARVGYPPVFVPDAEVYGEFPVASAAAGSQRKRWEHGHLQVMLAGAPRLLAAGVLRGRLDLVALALELGVPPLSSLGLLWVSGLVVLATVAQVGGPVQPMLFLAATGLLALAAVAAAWQQFARRLLPLGEMWGVPGYVVRKVPLYVGYFFHRQKEWVRTDRESACPTVPRV